MKKSLLALAVLTAISGAASAQSSVTLYGKVDVGMTYDSGSINGKSLRLDSGITGGSRIGLKGVEDLGGGTKASFQLETGFCSDSAAPQTNQVLDVHGKPVIGPGGKPETYNTANFCTGSNAFFGRQAYGALSGGFGSISGGRQYSLGFINLTTIDPFGTGLAGQINNVFDTSNTRLNNSVQYNTPVFGGFNLSGEISFGEKLGDWKANREVGAAITYASGPIYAGATYYDANSAIQPGGDPTARKTWQVGGTYDFGVVKLAGMVQETKNDQTLSNRFDRLNLMAGVTIPLAGGSVLASVLHSNDKETADADATQVGIGYMYPLSKRTSLYTAFAHLNDIHGAPFTVGNATAAGTGTKAFNLGVVHNF